MLKLPSDTVERLRPALEGRAVCVTGGAGFIGGHLVDALYGLGATIKVIDDLSSSSIDHIAELADLDPDRVQFIHASILDDAFLREALRGAATVFHLAAMSSVPRSIAQPERSLEVNVVGTLRVAHAALHAGVQRIVYSASSSAYGDAEPGQGPRPRIESQAPRPQSPYAAGKLSGEHVMQAWAGSFGVSTISLRYFNVFGPRQPADSPYAAAVAGFTRRLMAGEAPTIYGDGEQSRDFTYVANAVLANLLAAASPRRLAGEVVNIGSGVSVSLLDLYRRIAQRCGAAHVAPVHAPPRVGDVRHSLADLTRARQLLGYEPVMSLDEGLGETIAWHRAACADAGSGRG